MHTEVRCCCDPDNLIGLIPKEVGLEEGLALRELEDGGEAFDSDDDADRVRAMPGFQEAVHKPGGGKSWKKTWRKK